MKNRFSSIIYPLNALTTQLICRCCLIGISSWPPNLRLEQQNSPFCSGSWSWVAEPLDEGMQKLAYLQCLPRDLPSTKLQETGPRRKGLPYSGWKDIKLGLYDNASSLVQIDVRASAEIFSLKNSGIANIEEF